MLDKHKNIADWLSSKKFAVLRCLSKMFCYAVFRIRVYGAGNVPRTGSFILLSNHQSFLDPLYIGIPVPRRIRFVARDSLFKGRIAGTVMRACMAIPIKRGQGDLGAVKEILRTLKDGLGVGLFPEATRTVDGRIIDVKPGFGLLMRKSKATVIPTLIEGAYECWPRSQKMFLPGEITICYGEPILHEEVAKMSDEEFARVLTVKLRQMQNDCRRKLGKEPFDYSKQLAENR